MQELDAAKPLRHAMHVDVSVAREHAEARLAAALAAGGRIADASGAPAAWILADRAGNKVCISAWPDGAAEPDPPGPGLMAIVAAAGRSAHPGCFACLVGP